MPITKEIFNMFEFSRNQKYTFSIEIHFDEWPLSQQRSVPTEPLTLSMHRYLLIESHRKPPSLCGYTLDARYFLPSLIDADKSKCPSTVDYFSRHRTLGCQSSYSYGFLIFDILCARKWFVIKAGFKTKLWLRNSYLMACYTFYLHLLYCVFIPG